MKYISDYEIINEKYDISFVQLNSMKKFFSEYKEKFLNLFKKDNDEIFFLLNIYYKKFNKTKYETVFLPKDNNNFSLEGELKFNKIVIIIPVKIFESYRNLVNIIGNDFQNNIEVLDWYNELSLSICNVASHEIVHSYQNDNIFKSYFTYFTKSYNERDFEINAYAYSAILKFIESDISINDIKKILDFFNDIDYTKDLSSIAQIINTTYTKYLSNDLLSKINGNSYFMNYISLFINKKKEKNISSILSTVGINLNLKQGTIKNVTKFKNKYFEYLYDFLDKYKKKELIII